MTDAFYKGKPLIIDMKTHWMSNSYYTKHPHRFYSMLQDMHMVLVAVVFIVVDLNLFI